MPTYVYECSACNKVFEIEQRITEDPLKDCQCGSNGTVKRIIQPVGIAFKGSGFYVNDSSSVAPSSTPTKSES
ncbi:MAG: FmdB family transcriptional regulator [Armatimonadetes bacterium Cent15-Ar3]|jgi:putative FmdB family regulatory protein|nr:MAG: FmdB family transcriptional regulator [Armatimonadetes bacterium Cent15-Ar3]